MTLSRFATALAAFALAPTMQSDGSDTLAEWVQADDVVTWFTRAL